jgi:fructose-1,6-bisphosphatase
MDSTSKAKEYLEKQFNYVLEEFLDDQAIEDKEVELEDIVTEILNERSGIVFESEIDLEEDKDD